MDNLMKWRKMLFEVAKVDFGRMAGRDSNRKVTQNYIKIDAFADDDAYSGNGLCSFETKEFEQASFPFLMHSFGLRHPDSGKFKTSFDEYPESKRKMLNEICVAFYSTGPGYNKYYTAFIITTEGLKVACVPEKKKFFMHDGYDFDKSECISATFEDMATNKTFSIRGDIEINNKRVHLHCPIQMYLMDIVPKLIDLYKANTNLYIAALDDLFGDEY